jgi:hypothetical protein
MGASAGAADALCVLRNLNLLGQLLIDRNADTIGRINGTWPLDGGGEPEFALVRTGRFGETHLVPLADAEVVDGLLQVPFSCREVADGPTLEMGRYLHEQVDRARVHYLLEVEVPPAYRRTGAV